MRALWQRGRGGVGSARGRGLGRDACALAPWYGGDAGPIGSSCGRVPCLGGGGVEFIHLVISAVWQAGELGGDWCRPLTHSSIAAVFVLLYWSFDRVGLLYLCQVRRAYGFQGQPRGHYGVHSRDPQRVMVCRSAFST